MKYTVDYQYGTAKLYTPFEDWESRFYELASQCFGNRKSIGHVSLIEKSDDSPDNLYENEFERLSHNGDIIVWDKDGNKIKSEFDF